MSKPFSCGLIVKNGYFPTIFLFDGYLTDRAGRWLCSASTRCGFCAGTLLLTSGRFCDFQAFASGKGYDYWRFCRLSHPFSITSHQKKRFPCSEGGDWENRSSNRPPVIRAGLEGTGLRQKFPPFQPQSVVAV